MALPTPPRPLRVAVLLQLDTEHGRGILRGIAHFFRRHPEVAVWKFGRSGLSAPGLLRGLNLDGIIARAATPREERSLRSLGIPVINVSGQRATPRFATVNTDDAVVGRLAARHLISRGYRRLAYCGASDHLASRRRRDAFAAEARERGLPPAYQLRLPRSAAGNPEGKAHAALAAGLGRLPRPLGIFGFTDRVAIAVAEACQAAGLRVPEDAAVLGVGNDLTRLEFAQVDVSSIQLNTGRIGELAAQTLYDWLQGRRKPDREVLLPPVKIVTRRSTDLFAVDDEAVAQGLDHIRAHVGNPIYVADIARAAGVSRRILEMKFRRHLGTSIYAEVQRVHFEHAIELMGETGLTISEIAYASGFESAQRFSTAFRRRYGAPPARYRRDLRDGVRTGQTSRTQRKPVLPAPLSGVLLLRASVR